MSSHTIQPIDSPIRAKLILPGAKTITIRALLLSVLAEGVSEISGIGINHTTRAMIKALYQLGIAVQLDEQTKTCIIAGGSGKFPKKQATIWCEKSQALFQYLVASCAISSGVYYFDGPTPLSKKSPLKLLDLLICQGIQLIPNDAKKMPFTLISTESLEGGELTFNPPFNHHIVSALLMIAPFARSPFTFNLPGGADHPSIDMTCTMMAEYGVLVHRVHQTQLMVPIPQRYQAKDYVVEPDFGLAAYFFAAAAITAGEITIQPIQRSISKQANSKFTLLLEKMGCQVLETHSGLTLKGPEKLQGIEVSIRKFSDTFLALAAIAPFAKSATRIAHIGHISQKEYDRMIAFKNGLIKMGLYVETGNDWIKIFPGIPKACSLNIHADYRVGMAFAIIGLKTPGIVIENSEYIKKIYPDFLPTLNRLQEETTIKI